MNKTRPPKKVRKGLPEGQLHAQGPPPSTELDARPMNLHETLIAHAPRPAERQHPAKASAIPLHAYTYNTSKGRGGRAPPQSVITRPLPSDSQQTTDDCRRWHYRAVYSRQGNKRSLESRCRPAESTLTSRATRHARRYQ